MISTQAWSWQRPTTRLRFREIGLDDADLLVALDADPRVRQFLFRTPPPRAVVVDRILPALQHEYRRHPGFGRWIAFDDSDSFVGWFGLRVHDDPRRPSLGYRLARSAWGRGLATEAGRALIERALTDLGAEQVSAQTMAVNERSRRVMDGAGCAASARSSSISRTRFPGPTRERSSTSSRNRSGCRRTGMETD